MRLTNHINMSLVGKFDELQYPDHQQTYIKMSFGRTEASVKAVLPAKVCIKGFLIMIVEYYTNAQPFYH